MANATVIEAKANQTVLVETFKVMDKLYKSAEKAETTANIAWAGIALLGQKYGIKASVICDRYGVKKDWYNTIIRGAKMLDTGKLTKQGVPILGTSKWAVKDEDGKVKADYTIAKLARLSGIGEDEEITAFIEEKKITPETSQADLIKAIAEYKKSKEQPQTETEEGETEEGETATVQTTTDEYEICNEAFQALQRVGKIAKNKEEFENVLKTFTTFIMNEGYELTKDAE
jgi:hypothetical protein